MSILCVLFGHKYSVRRVDASKRLKESEIKFNTERYRKAYEMVRNTSLDPEKEYVCRRCGHIVSGYDRFLMYYMFL